MFAIGPIMIMEINRDMNNALLLIDRHQIRYNSGVRYPIIENMLKRFVNVGFNAQCLIMIMEINEGINNASLLVDGDQIRYQNGVCDPTIQNMLKMFVNVGFNA